MARYINYTGKTVTCKKCGDEQLGWAESKKGKFYLAPVYVLDGGLVFRTVGRGRGFVRWHKCNEYQEK